MLLYTPLQGEQGARRQMRLVVVGGQGRKVGKTSVIAGLIRGLKTLAWTAVKISHHAEDTGNEARPLADDGEPVGARRVAPTPTIDLGRHNLPAHLDYLLSEERDREGHGDTSLYLAAGARRALWLRAREGGLARALPGLLEALEGDEYVIIESNSLLGFLKPAVFLMVIDESGGDLKASARQFFGRADAFVTVVAGPRLWPARALQLPQDKPAFAVSPSDWSNPGLCRFVSERLRFTAGSADARLWGPRLL
jgi:hypothetical protein